MTSGSSPLRVVRVEFVRGPPTLAWRQLMHRLLQNPKTREPAATQPEPRRAKEATNDTITSA